jgi:hypothetical protein
VQGAAVDQEREHERHGRGGRPQYEKVGSGKQGNGSRESQHTYTGAIWVCQGGQS